MEFQSTRLSRASTTLKFECDPYKYISIHKALASLDGMGLVLVTVPQIISIHKALASLDDSFHHVQQKRSISIHKALASLDRVEDILCARQPHFNPQGSREPRLMQKRHLMKSR